MKQFQIFECSMNLEPLKMYFDHLNIAMEEKLISFQNKPGFKCACEVQFSNRVRHGLELAS